MENQRLQKGNKVDIYTTMKKKMESYSEENPSNAPPRKAHLHSVQPRVALLDLILLVHFQSSTSVQGVIEYLVQLI